MQRKHVFPLEYVPPPHDVMALEPAGHVKPEVHAMHSEASLPPAVGR